MNVGGSGGHDAKGAVNSYDDDAVPPSSIPSTFVGSALLSFFSHTLRLCCTAVLRTVLWFCWSWKGQRLW